MKTSSVLPRASVFFLLAVTASACGQKSSADVSEQAAAERTVSGGVDAEPAASRDCGYSAGGKNKPRKVVVSHPYDADGNAATGYEVFSLATDGTLTTTGTTFTLGTLTGGEIVFTPDGQVGLAAQDDGSIGVFRFDHGGAVHVVSTGITDIAYATKLAMDPSGERVYVLSTQWRESGGGVFSARIACDGTLTSEGLVAASKLPSGLLFMPPLHAADKPRAVVVATDILDSAAGNSVHLLHLGKAPAVISGVDGFGDDQAIVSTVAKTPDNRYVLVADNSAFSGIENRISVVGVVGNTLRRTQILTPVYDPMAVVLSPYENAGLVVSGYGNAIYHLTYDARAATPFVNDGDITYIGKKPSLPATAILVDRGPLRGRVVVVETEGLRQVEFQPDGTIQDLGLTSLGDGLDTIVGGLGIAP